MKKLWSIAAAFICFSTLNAQQNEITLETDFGSENKEIQDILRFQEIETCLLKFKGNDLKGKNYIILVKEFTNGSLAKIDTIMNSKTYEYVPAIDSDAFSFKYFVKTEINNKIKMTFMFDRFSTTKYYDIKTTEDAYALHDFLGSEKSVPIETKKSTYILGYFLPYLEKETGWKKYCEVSGSKYAPEEWGKVFNIPNYFLVQILFD